MAKKRTKEIIPEKTPQKRGTDSYSYEKACNAAKNSGTPTYRFAVGDRVQVGHLPNCVVEEVMDDGAMYLIRVTTKDHVEYSCWAWTSVRPLDDDKDTHFAKRNSARVTEYPPSGHTSSIKTMDCNMRLYLKSQDSRQWDVLHQNFLAVERSCTYTVSTHCASTRAPTGNT